MYKNYWKIKIQKNPINFAYNSTLTKEDRAF